MGNFINRLSNYQPIPRELIFDSTMSDRARFVFCYMAAKPDGWNFYLDPMAKELGYCKDTLRKYIQELVDTGWLERSGQDQSNSGKFGAVEYILNDTPHRNFSDAVKNRHGKKPTRKNTDANIIDTIIETDIENKRDEESALAISHKTELGLEIVRVEPKPRDTTEPRTCLFANSRFANFEDFEACFSSAEFQDVDILYYYQCVADWSASKGAKKKDWIATARGFMRRDNDAGKLKRKVSAMSNEDRQAMFKFLEGDY